MGLVSQSQIMFENDYDGGANDADEGFCMKQTSDGGYIMSGATWVDDNAWYDIAIMKADNEGNFLWTKTFGYGSGNIEVGYGIVETEAGGYMVAGGTDGITGNNNMLAICTDADGNELWSGNYGGDSDEYAHACDNTSDGGYILAGATNSFGAGMDDAYLVRIDGSGNEIWSAAFGTAMFDYVTSVIQTEDGGFVAAGSTNGDAFIFKTDGDGNEVWTKIYGGAANDEIFSIKQTSDGGYIATGKNMSEGAGDYDIWLLKLDANGDMIWSQVYGGEKKDQGFSVSVCSDGGYFIAGYTESFAQAEEDSDTYLVKTSSTGLVQWTKSYGNVADDGAKSGTQTTDGGFAAFGYKYVSGQELNFYLVKTNQDGVVGTNSLLNDYSSLNVYPNPAKNNAKIEFSNPENETYELIMTNMNGQVVKRIQSIIDERVIINKDNLPNGIYFIELRGNQSYRSKIIFE